MLGIACQERYPPTKARMVDTNSKGSAVLPFWLLVRLLLYGSQVLLFPHLHLHIHLRQPCSACFSHTDTITITIQQYNTTTTR